MTNDEALIQQALEALEEVQILAREADGVCERRMTVIQTLRDRLASRTRQRIIPSTNYKADSQEQAEPYVLSTQEKSALKASSKIVESVEQSMNHRWNIEKDGEDLLVCEGNHSKNEDCHYIRYVPSDGLGIADVWHEGSKKYYTAKLLKEMTPEEVAFSSCPLNSKT